jgi:DNA-directed RNA polymerase subunit P
MTEYKCFNCNKKIPANIIRRRIRCPYCGSKILFKPRSVPTKIKAK